MQNHTDLKGWEKSHLFTLKVYDVTRHFLKEALSGLTNQLRQAASSISATVAGGCGWNSKHALAHYLNISSGSANEAEDFLILSKEWLYSEAISSRVLSNFINVVRL